jgi:Fe-S-cluster containining protein
MTLISIIEKATIDQRSDSARALRKPRSTKRLLKMATRALERADQAIKDVADVLPPPQPIACGPECPYCCHIRVTASAPEVLLVLSHIARTWDEAAIKALKRKVKNIDGLTRGLNDDERAKLRLPCPLLKDGSCAAHSVRPLSCRALASVNLSACKAAYACHMAKGVPTYEPQYQAANAVGYGLYAGLADAGYDVENIELTAALAIGLNAADEDRDLARAWLKGQSPFAPIKL